MPDHIETDLGNPGLVSNTDSQELDALGHESPRSDAQDLLRLHALGYRQELARRLSGFSNFALSLSIICILAGGVTSFHLGLCSVGGASIGLGWPLVVLFALAVAASMGQLASTFPTAGGLYHWAAILGGRGWGWATAWFNLAGLVTVLAAINVGTYRFAADALGYGSSTEVLNLTAQAIAVALITASQAAINHRGITATSRLTDFSGYWILIVAASLTVCLLFFAHSFEPVRLITFANYSGSAGGDVWPANNQLAMLFALGALLPAYTITGFDASAHAAEETHDATTAVPVAIVRSVLVSGIVGWLLLATVVLAAPNLSRAAARGPGAFLWILDQVLPRSLTLALCVGIVIAQYLCGLATVTSASRIAYAFARDGGLPYSRAVRYICPVRHSPPVAIWSVSIASVLFTLHTPVYSTITAICTIFLYISYALPTAIGAWAYGRSWTVMGPWHLGRWYRPLAIITVVGCIALIWVGMQPPNENSVWVVAATALALLATWFARARRTFPGPPRMAIADSPSSPVPSIDHFHSTLPQPTDSAPPRQSPSHSPISINFEQIRARTPARILTGPASTTYRTATYLDLRRDHAAAKDAVNTEFDLTADFASDFVAQWNLFEIGTLARTKEQFLLNPELGRSLDPQARDELLVRCPTGADIQVVIADGLSAAAVRVQVPPLLPQLASETAKRAWRFGQPFFVRHGRVGLMNDVGAILGPKVVILLIGERPGLATAESLSAYMAYHPRPGDDDSRRNLISNIHARGVPTDQAAIRIAQLADLMIQRSQSGVAVKEEGPGERALPSKPTSLPPS